VNKQSRFFQSVVWLGSFGMLGLGIGLGMSGHSRALEPAESAGGGHQPAKAPPAGGGVIEIPPPPADVIELSMEVAALRTLYLLNVWPDHNNGSWKYHTNPPFVPILELAKKYPPEPPTKKRAPAVVSDAYKNALIELRAAYIRGQDDRIIDLTDQLEELAEDDDNFALDDTVEITPHGRHNAWERAPALTPECIVNYLNSYGKEFPSPVNMLGRAMMERDGAKISDETVKLVSKEVAAAAAGFPKPVVEEDKKTKAKKLVEHPGKAPELEQKLTKLLEKASGMSVEECKTGWKLGGPLRKEWDLIVKETLKNQYSSFHIIENMMRQDLAELFSNPRLIPAIKAREDYLTKAGLFKGAAKEDPEANGY
jgi:hypothetical protein